MKNCILYLVRTSKEDLEGLNKSLELLEKNILGSCKEKPDIVLFHESSFDETYKNSVVNLDGIQILFSEIEFKLPNYSKEILEQIPEYYPHPTHGPGGPYAHTLPEPHKGFTMGYRHMCRFFSGLMYEQKILKNYEYYLRLDTDSFILSKIGYDIFEWMKENNVEYGFIEPAVQFDNPKVILGLWQTTKDWLLENEELIPKVSVSTIPEGKMFYTNFELGKVSSFTKGSDYHKFYNFLDENGGIYKYRWGDAPIKYLGVNLFIDGAVIKPVKGFVYQHGAIYHI